jgi:hypothetical protein
MKKLLLAIIICLMPLLSSASGPGIFMMASVKGSIPTTPVISAAGGDTTATVTLNSGDVGFLTNILYWDTTSHPGSAGTEYLSYANSIISSTLVTAGFPSTPYVHTGRTNGTTYYYRLRGTDVAGSTQSNETSAAAASFDITDFEIATGMNGWTSSGPYAGGDSPNGSDTQGIVATGLLGGTHAYKVHVAGSYSTPDDATYLDDWQIEKTVAITSGSFSMQYACPSGAAPDVTIGGIGAFFLNPADFICDGTSHSVSKSTAGFTGSKLIAIDMPNNLSSLSSPSTADIYIRNIKVPN